MVRGRGGVAAVNRATGLGRAAIRHGIDELESGEVQQGSGRTRIRRPGGGRKRATTKDPTLLSDLDSLVNPVTRGDPESPLRWVATSLRTLASELATKGHSVSHALVRRLLRSQGYSLQGNQKVLEGKQHPDRNAQFEYINALVAEIQAGGNPAISVDAKKKENLGDFKNGGREYAPKGEPEKVRTHDFIDKELGKAIPYGIYDIVRNEGWVSVGIDHDTAEFAVASVRRWWYAMGKECYPGATELLLTADCGGSNGNRTRLWKVELQRLADELRIPITVCHFPPGTSKWNKIEHRLFSFITMNWRARPLLSLEVVVELIAATTTRQGLRVRAEVDPSSYQKGIKVPDAEMHRLNLLPHHFHGEWNYTFFPSSQARIA